METKLIDFGSGIYAIDQQMVRAFLVVGKTSALLIDTGAVQTDILSYINNTTNLPVKVILTHGDRDHIENLGCFNEAWAHKNDIDSIQRERSKVTLHPVSEGDRFDLGGRVLKVLETPGHTPGSISLLDEDNGILFSGDTVSYGPVFMFGENRNMQLYIQSLKKLRDMREAGKFHQVYCCHNICPVSGDIIDDLLKVATGIVDGSITGEKAKLPVIEGMNESPLLAKCGKCGILYL